MYQHEMARTGKHLFFFRGTYIYAIIATSTFIAWTARDLGPFTAKLADQLWFILSLSIAVLGAVVRVITSGYAALGTSGRAKRAAEASELNTTGPYSLVRNPLYVGRILNFTGLAMMSGSFTFGMIVCLLAIIIYERISVYEEEYLREKFGPSHSAWAKNVPALFPRFHGWVAPKYPFWWKRMIWREQNKLFLLATAVFLTWFARSGFDVAQWNDRQMLLVYAYAGLVIIRFFIGGLKMNGFFKALS